MNNKMDFKKFTELIEEYKETGLETLEIKTNVIVDLIDKIEKEEIKNQILLVQKYNLILALKKKGVKPEEIKEILDVKGK